MRTTPHSVSLPGGTSIQHSFDALDLNYVLSGNNIGVGYVFENTIDLDLLKESLVELLKEFPALAGRADFDVMAVSDLEASVPVTHVENYPGQATDYAVMGENIGNRTDFVTEYSLKDIVNGAAPLMSVKLTTFAKSSCIKGSCVLGVTINHSLMDAAGFNLIMHRWSDLFTGRASKSLSDQGPFHNFATTRKTKAVLADIQAAGVALPLNFNTIWGRLLKRLMFGGLEKIRARGREMIYYSAADVAAIKAAVQVESGLNWVSTHMALGAHVLHAIAPLQLPAKTRSVNIGNVINIRQRFNPNGGADRETYVGNALFIMMSELTSDRPIHDLSRGDFAKALRAAFDELSEDRIGRDMQNITDSLNAGYGYPGLSLFKPIMALNNQSKMNIYGVDFGAGKLLRVIPHDVGDHVMIYPAADGGTEVYIRDFKSLKRQKRLLEHEWQTRLRAIQTQAYSSEAPGS